MEKSARAMRISHITIGVSDLRKSVSFYQDIVGLEKIGEWPGYALFDVAGVTLGLNPKEKLEICMLVDDVNKAYQNLREKGTKFAAEPRDQPWGGQAATFFDPEGNKVTIETFHCKVCGKTCQSYREFLEEHLRKHK